MAVDQTVYVNDSPSLHHRPEFWDGIFYLAIIDVINTVYNNKKKIKHVSYDKYVMLIMFFHNISLKLYVHLLDLGMVAYVNKE